MPSKKRKVAEPAVIQDCIGCEVLVQKDAMNEQNIDLFRQEMAERWRLQEGINRTLQNLIGTMSSSVNTFVSQMHTSNQVFLERIHKLEKNLVYVTITVVVAALAAWGAKLLP